MTDKTDNDGNPEKPDRRKFLKRVAVAGAGAAVAVKNPTTFGTISAASDSIASSAMSVTGGSIINTQHLLSVLPGPNAEGYRIFHEQLKNLQNDETTEFDDLKNLLEIALQQKTFYLLSDSIDAQRPEGAPSSRDLLSAFSDSHHANSKTLREAYIKEDFLNEEDWRDDDDERTNSEIANDRVNETINILEEFITNATPPENIDQVIADITEKLDTLGHSEYKTYADNFIVHINQIITEGNIGLLKDAMIGALDESLPESSMFHVVHTRAKAEEPHRPSQLPSQNAKTSPNFALTPVAEGVKKAHNLPLPQDGKPELVTPTIDIHSMKYKGTVEEKPKQLESPSH